MKEKNVNKPTDESFDSPFAFEPKTLSNLVDPKSLISLKNLNGLEGLIKGLHTNSQTGLNTSESNLSPVTINDINKGKYIENTSENQEEYEEAAIISLGLGLYQDFGKKENNEPKIHWIEGVAILVAVLIVVSVGSLNDWQKERQFRKLNAKKEDREVKVIRNGKESLLSVHEVLVGDILKLEPGDIIPCDGVVIEAHNLKCDESAATGESDAVKKLKYEECIKELKGDETDSTYKSKFDPFIISGSKVLEGVGSYVVIAVGVNSFNGKTMMALRIDPEETPLQLKLNDLAEKIAKLGGAAALLMLIVLLIIFFVDFRHQVPSLTDAFKTLISIVISTVTVIVVAVPEGLPLAVTLALAFATTRMLRDNNLVRVLSACETMGNATTICSDKTGTLTQNNMTVVAGTLGLTKSFAKDLDNHKNGIEVPILLKDLSKNIPIPILKLLEESIVINSTAFESTDENGQITFTGSKTETALLNFLINLNCKDFMKLRKIEPTEVFPFSSDRKAMGVVMKLDSKWRFYVKGASEFILRKTKSIVKFEESDDEILSIEDLTNENVTELQKIIENYARQSLRTIGLAYRDFSEWPPKGIIINNGEIAFDDLDKDTTLLGIVGIEDPLRDGVREAVQDCLKAGVKVRMVTGDNILTATSIASQCGIYTNGKIMEGYKFRNLSPQEMDDVVPKLQVLARSSPEDKRILVLKLREQGEIVAVTGDGTNDGPALKSADVGFSMGIAGTEVAKEASSIILMDDNFSSIVKAIMWGRSVNDAVKKFLQFQLTVNVTAVLLTFISAVSNSEQEAVLTAVQLLWVNLIMDTLAALALATDPPTPDLLDRNPEPKTAPLISFQMWKMIIGQSIFQLVVTLVLLYRGFDILGDDAHLPTVIFNTFVFMQIFNEVNCRRLDNKLNIFKNIWANKFFVFIFVIMIGTQILLVTFGGAAFQTESLNIQEWLVCIGLGFLSIPIGVIIRLLPSESKLQTAPQTRPSSSFSIEMDGRGVWDDAHTKVKDQLSVIRTLRGGRLRAHFGDNTKKPKKGIAAAIAAPSLMLASVTTGWNQNPEKNHSEQGDVQTSFGGSAETKVAINDDQIETAN
ncbi:9310_t:CDS:2 [Diversispora eburnea]|uniref:Calcium-transporting ATPase n=1 Tax=Diversispora eburnea TaxID=1213867 RepID=A0A9N8ZG70_9GLOM|nr:9310_t:CDS:2 [Diversispora eburnea]